MRKWIKIVWEIVFIIYKYIWKLEKIEKILTIIKKEILKNWYFKSIIICLIKIGLHIIKEFFMRWMK